MQNFVQKDILFGAQFYIQKLDYHHKRHIIQPKILENWISVSRIWILSHLVGFLDD